MRNTITVIMLLGILSASAAGFAATPGPSGAQPAKQKSSTSIPGNHAVRGVVKSVDASSLVIERAGKKPSSLTFVMNPSTQRDGAVAVGSTVSVRYHPEGKTMVATAVSADPKRSRQAAK